MTCSTLSSCATESYSSPTDASVSTAPSTSYVPAVPHPNPKRIKAVWRTWWHGCTGMPAVAELTGPRFGLVRLLRIAPLVETAHRARVLSAALLLATQVYLYYVLWTALYRGGSTQAGLTGTQAVTYSTLAVLYTGTRWASRRASRDSVQSLIRT